MEKGEINHPAYSNKRTLGQIAADKFTKWVGSWGFIFAFMTVLLIWIFINAYLLFKYNIGDPFDPYPFILLNLVLSCIAAIQAPVILMSQNREMQRDRVRSEYDYQVNRKAEKEIESIKIQLDRIEKKLK
jgi:uncharacterized membrane protein